MVLLAFRRAQYWKQLLLLYARQIKGRGDAKPFYNGDFRSMKIIPKIR